MHKILVTFLILISISFAAEYSDNFNRASLGANWTQLTGINNMQILSSDTLGYITGSALCGIYYSAASESDSMYVEIEIVCGNLSNLKRMYIATNVQSGANTYYAAGPADNRFQNVMYKCVAGDTTWLSYLPSGFTPWDNGDTLGLLHFDDTLICFQNGTPIDTATDSDISDGYPGVVQYPSVSYLNYYDNFYAVDSTGGAPACDTPSIPITVFTDTLHDTLFTKHTSSTWDDADSIIIDSIIGGDTAWTLNYTTTDSFAIIIRHTAQSLIYWSVYYCTDDTMTGVDTVRAIIDSIGIDSVVDNNGVVQDTVNWGDTGLILMNIPKYASFDSIYFGSTKIEALYVKTGTQDTIGFVYPDSTGWFEISVCDTILCDTCNNPDSIYVMEAPGTPATGTITISTHPVSDTVDIGGTSKFWAIISSDTTTDTVWQRDTGTGWYNTGVSYDSLILISVQYASNLDSIRAIYTTYSDTDTTNVALLVVNPDTVEITTHPQDTSILSGGTATFTVVATGTAPITYQWQIKPVGGAWGDTSGQTSTSFVWTTDTSRSLDTVRCIATNAGGSDTSNNAVLYVYPLYSIDTTWVEGIATWTITPDTGRIDSNAQVISIVTVSAGYSFVAFTGGRTGSNPNDTFNISGNLNISADINPLPVIDSIRPNPWYRNDSASIYGSYFETADGSEALNNLTTTESINFYFWSNTQIDFHTASDWPRGKNEIEIVNPSGQKDTSWIWIVIPSKTSY